ncbi:hypothetical protein J3E69DRAFT_325717 [Trichoderma sp. SZMC 28015]
MYKCVLYLILSITTSHVIKKIIYLGASIKHVVCMSYMTHERTEKRKILLIRFLLFLTWETWLEK